MLCFKLILLSKRKIFEILSLDSFKIQTDNDVWSINITKYI